MTAVRTQFEAGCYAVTASSQNILILNRFKQITVAKLDDFTPLFDALSIDVEKRVPVEVLINACIVYSLADDLGLSPGIFAEGDKAILEHCRTNISQEVIPTDRELVLQELKTAWQQIATHPLLKKYIQLGEYMGVDNQANCQFAPMGGFEIFVLDYFTGVIKAYVNSGANQFELLKQWVYLVFSVLHGDGFIANRFIATDLFFKKTEAILVEAGQRKAEVEALLQKAKKEQEIYQSTWFVDITGWAKIELLDIEDLADAGEILTNLLERLPQPPNDDMEDQLKDLRAQFNVADDKVNKLMLSCRFPDVDTRVVELNHLMKEVIVFAIYSYAKDNDIMLYPASGPLPPYRLAGLSKRHEQQLMEYMLDEENGSKMQAFELFSIMRKAKDETLRDIARQTIARRAKAEEFIVITKRFGLLSITQGPFVIGSAFMPRLEMTPQFTRLERAAKGAAPKNSGLTDEKTPVDPNSAENAVQDTLNLQRSQCVIL